MWGIRDWVTHLTVHPPARSALIIHAVAALAFALFAGPRRNEGKCLSQMLDLRTNLLKSMGMGRRDER